VTSLTKLGEAYCYLYETWPKTVTEYGVNMLVPCFEYYDKRYRESGAFDLYIPILKK
jgi:predicted transcriptional regulator YdeE